MKLVDIASYKASINSKRLKLQKLKETNRETQKLKENSLQKNYEGINEIFYYHSLLFLLRTILTKLISRHYDNLLIGHYGI